MQRESRTFSVNKLSTVFKFCMENGLFLLTRNKQTSIHREKPLRLLARAESQDVKLQSVECIQALALCV